MKMLKEEGLEISISLGIVLSLTVKRPRLTDSLWHSPNLSHPRRFRAISRVRRHRILGRLGLCLHGNVVPLEFSIKSRAADPQHLAR